MSRTGCNGLNRDENQLRYAKSLLIHNPNMDREVKDAIRSQLEVSTGIVTYKSLCVSLGWNSEQSKRNLGLYSQLDKKMNRTFCLSGLSRKNGGPMVCLFTSPNKRWLLGVGS
nr:unnamed protein product [Spirometra erinaceieuropaei]